MYCAIMSSMVTTLKGTNVRLLPSIRTFVDERIESITRLLSSKHRDEAKMAVEVGKPSQHHRKGAVFYAEVTLEVGRKLFRATAEDEDMHTAVDLVRDDIKRQLRKEKTKTQSRRRKLRSRD